MGIAVRLLASPLREVYTAPGGRVGAWPYGGCVHPRVLDPPDRGRLAQLARAPPLQGGGHRFESCNAHQPGSARLVEQVSRRKEKGENGQDRRPCRPGWPDGKPLTCGLLFYFLLFNPSFMLCGRAGGQGRGEQGSRGERQQRASPLTYEKGN